VTGDEHAQQLGGLVGNLHSLEFLLRGYLGQQPGARPFGLPPGTNIYSFEVGSEVPENDLTSFDTLGRLVEKFNASMAAKGLQGIDTSLVALRDAIAHGRVSAPVADEHLRLLKFEKPSEGKTRITYNEVMDLEWFKANKRKVYDAMMYVHGQLES
jgi:hypothetical protein